MDPQQIERIAGNLRKIIDQGGPEADVLAYLREEGFESREAWLEALNAPPPPTFETTPQPPFATLPPMVGGALDALVAFGNLGAFGLPAMLSKDTREYTEELKERAPDAYMASGVAAGLATGLASTPLFAARTAAIGPYSVAQGGPALQQIPSIAGQAARTVGGAVGQGVQRGASFAGRALRNQATQTVGGMLGGGLLMKWLLGRQ